MHDARHCHNEVTSEVYLPGQYAFVCILKIFKEPFTFIFFLSSKPINQKSLSPYFCINYEVVKNETPTTKG